MILVSETALKVSHLYHRSSTAHKPLCHVCQRETISILDREIESPSTPTACLAECVARGREPMRADVRLQATSNSCSVRL